MNVVWVETEYQSGHAAIKGAMSNGGSNVG